MDAGESADMIQSVMIIVGTGTLIQLFPIWRIGSGLRIVMGISFTFVSIACVVGAKYGYGAVLGADEEKSRCFGFFFELRFGIYTSPRIFDVFPDIVKTVFAENCVAIVFVTAIVLDRVLPVEKDAV